LSAALPVIGAFARLSIAPTRDVKTIKRAYAVALKAIDQASEREAFERLREAYEQALAWAARNDDADDELESEDEQQEEEQEEEEDEPCMPHAGLPDAPPLDVHRVDAPRPLALPPGQPATVPTAVTQSQDEARQALRHWTDQLRNAPPADPAALLDAALADPRLLHLDNHAQLEARIADLLHDDPPGRALLFDAAAVRFHWTDRNARPFASAEAAHWISRVVNQGLQWQAQTASVIDLQRKALDTVARVPSPDASQTRRFAEVLADMAVDFPDWFALHLGPQGHAHLPEWQAVQVKLARRGTRQVERKERYFGTRNKTLVTLLGSIFVLLVFTAMLSGVISSIVADPAPLAVAASKGTNQAGLATPEPVLAYEFTGALTRDSCESTEEFVRASNWLEVDDSDAVALLATRAMRCQDKGLWSRKDDPLMACLRAERATALGAGRPENSLRCLSPKAAGP
jgi:hypothetical protein